MGDKSAKRKAASRLEPDAADAGEMNSLFLKVASYSGEAGQRHSQQKDGCPAIRHLIIVIIARSTAVFSARDALEVGCNVMALICEIEIVCGQSGQTQREHRNISSVQPAGTSTGLKIKFEIPVILHGISVAVHIVLGILVARKDRGIGTAHASDGHIAWHDARIHIERQQTDELRGNVEA